MAPLVWEVWEAEEELKCAFWEVVRHDIALMVSGVLTFAFHTP